MLTSCAHWLTGGLCYGSRVGWCASVCAAGGGAGGVLYKHAAHSTGACTCICSVLFKLQAALHTLFGCLDASPQHALPRASAAPHPHLLPAMCRLEDLRSPQLRGVLERADKGAHSLATRLNTLLHSWQQSQGEAQGLQSSSSTAVQQGEQHSTDTGVQQLQEWTQPGVPSTQQLDAPYSLQPELPPTSQKAPPRPTVRSLHTPHDRALVAGTGQYAALLDSLSTY